MELLELLHNLSRLEALAYDAGPTEATWESLTLTYRKRPAIDQGLDFLDSASAAELVHFFESEMAA